MNTTVLIALILAPWLATFAGSFFGATKELKSNKQQGGFLGFAAGIMIAASVWSLIIPAFDGLPALSGTIVATVGFLLGCGFMLFLDKVVPHQHMDEDQPEGSPSSLSRPTLLVMQKTRKFKSYGKKTISFSCFRCLQIFIIIIRFPQYFQQVVILTCVTVHYQRFANQNSLLAYWNTVIHPQNPSLN